MKRHRLDSTSLVAGVLFVLVAGTYLVAQHDDRSIDARWVLPLLLVGLGVAGLAGAVQSLTTRATENGSEPPAPSEPEPESVDAESESVDAEAETGSR